MARFPRLAELDQLHTSYLILLTVVALGLATVVFYYNGLLGGVFQILGGGVRGAIRHGFLVWRRLFAWADWPVFLLLELIVLGVGCTAAETKAGWMILAGLAPLFMGVTACLAYMFIDLERYEVERGYKALHNPMKGQELARHLVLYGNQVDLYLLFSAAVGIIGGFALLNLGLSRSVGQNWYRLAEGQAAYPDFLAYSLIHLYSIVDLLDLANSQQLLRVAVVKPAKWPASTLLALFKMFFTLVLLQQIFASVRKGRLLAEMIADFWSPHEPIQERARTALPQYGVFAIGPLLQSLRSVPVLTKEQRDGLPVILATIGPSTIPILTRHLHDPHEHVRAVVVGALGHLHAIDSTPLLVPLAKDPSDIVRLSLIEALGAIGASPQPVRKNRILRSAVDRVAWLKWWRQRSAPMTPTELTDLVVATLRTALSDESAAVRTQAARALGRIGSAAVAAEPGLVALLQDVDETVRCQAATALGQLGRPEPETTDALMALLGDGSAAVREAAARALGAMKSAAAPAVPALVPLLQDREESVRTAAAKAISQVGPLAEPHTDALVEGLASPDNLVRAQTAEALGTIGTAAQAAAPALVEAMGNGNDRVRAKAVEALGKIGEPAAEVAVPTLVRALRDQDNWVSALAAEALGEMGESADQAVPALIRAMGHVNPILRGNAAEALGKMGEAAVAARPALEQAARDEDGGVRCQAIRSLGAIGQPTPSTRRTVRGGLQDADPTVRAAAMEALGRWGVADAALLEELMPLLEDANDRVKIQAVQALPKLAGATPEVIAGLCRRLLEDDCSEVQVQSALALGKLGPAAVDAGGALLRATQTEELDVREQAMRAIAMIQPPEVMEAFAAGLKDASSDIRKVASGGWIKAATIPEEVIPALVEALQDPVAQVRANAATALARLEALPDEAIAPLIACTADASDGLRLSAAVALKRASGSEVAETMRCLTEDANMRIRVVAASALLAEDPGDPKGGAVLVEALGDPAPQVRKTALELVETLGADGIVFLETLRRRGEREEEATLRGSLARLVRRLSSPSFAEEPLAAGSRQG